MALTRTKKPATRRAKRTLHDVVLRITLEDIEPPIWREIAVLDTTTLPELHRVIQVAFQWFDYHLHQFTVGEDCYTIPDDELEDFGLPARSALGVTLSQLGLIEGAQFTYEYDFGDSWTHRIEVRRISPAADHEGVMPAPLLVDGRRAAPPEDCGGPPGYEELLRVLADQSDPKHADMRTWVGPDFNPERFDVRAARHALIMTAVWGALG
jgi:Plasmid pRiA4b ORF-3-like protein